MIPFLHQLDYNIQSSAAIHNAYEVAPAAGPVVIGIGHQLVNIRDDDLNEIKAHVSTVLPGVDARIVMEYSVLIASALLVSFPSIANYNLPCYATFIPLIFITPTSRCACM